MMNIKVLGPGCRNCRMLEERTHEALGELGLSAELEKVTDPTTIVGYGVMSTPGLVVDERVVVSGKVPTVRQLTELLRR
jgi:small redox-active disulfide protein 2